MIPNEQIKASISHEITVLLELTCRRSALECKNTHREREKSAATTRLPPSSSNLNELILGEREGFMQLQQVRSL